MKNELKTKAVVFVGILPFKLTSSIKKANFEDSKKVLIAPQCDQLSTSELQLYDLIIRSNFHDSMALDDAISQIESKFELIAVFGFSELSVLPAAYITDKTGANGSSIDTALACRNKFTMRKALSALHVSVPRFHLFQPNSTAMEAEHACGPYPLICKPLLGFASKGVIRVENEHELTKAVRRINRDNAFVLSSFYDLFSKDDVNKVLVESFVKGREFAVDGIAVDGEVSVLQIIGKPDVSDGPYFPDSIHISPAQINFNDSQRLTDAAKNSVSAVGLQNGPFHLEARIDGNQVNVIEIGARIGFPRLLKLSTGIDIVKLSIDLNFGARLPQFDPASRFAGNLCIQPYKAGYFSEISNIDALRSLPNVEEIVVFAELGDKVHPSPDSSGYIGFAIVVASTYQEVEATLYNIRDTIDVVIEERKRACYG